jgi:hypothetical protein
MASKVTDNVVAGDILIIEELAKHLKYSQEERKFMIRLAKKGVIAVESLLEEAISKVGKIERYIEDGEDFKDKSDAKKAIVGINDIKTGTRIATIGNVSGKKGKLRIMIAEPLTQKLYYFIVPNEEVKGKHNIKVPFSKTGGITDKMLLKMNQKNYVMSDNFSERIWLKYRVNSFKELCIK